MKTVYLDYASAGPVRQEVLDEMLPYFKEHFGNPSNVYDIGQTVKQVIEEQRTKTAGLIGAEPDEIIFTSSGAEANNLAIKGTAFAHCKKGRHIIVSSIEHHSVINAVRFLERLDFEATFLPVNKHGLVNPNRLAEAIRPETVLASIMLANNEIGTIEPIAEIAKVCREKRVIFHTDAVAAVGSIPVDVAELNVDLLSFSGAPLGAPKGIGGLYFRKKMRLMPLIHGGIQENGRRGGTENVPGIIGLGRAAELAKMELPDKVAHDRILREHLIEGIKKSVPEAVLTGHPEMRLPGHASFCINAIEGEALIYMLAQQGIYTNTGSACASKALKISPVLGAIGIPPALAQGSIVFTLDRRTTIEDIDYVLEKAPAAIEKLRSFSPVWGRKEPAYAETVCEY